MNSGSMLRYSRLQSAPSLFGTVQPPRRRALYSHFNFEEIEDRVNLQRIWALVLAWPLNDGEILGNKFKCFSFSMITLVMSGLKIRKVSIITKVLSSKHRL